MTRNSDQESQVARLKGAHHFQKSLVSPLRVAQGGGGEVAEFGKFGLKQKRLNFTHLKATKDESNSLVRALTRVLRKLVHMLTLRRLLYYLVLLCHLHDLSVALRIVRVTDILSGRKHVNSNRLLVLHDLEHDAVLQVVDEPGAQVLLVPLEAGSVDSLRKGADGELEVDSLASVQFTCKLKATSQ